MLVDLLAQLRGREEEREGVVVRLGQERDPAGSTDRAQPFEDVGGSETRLLDERAGDREAEPELRVMLEHAEEAVEGGPIAALGDPPEDVEVPVEVEVGTPRAQVEVTEPGESPRLVEVEVEDDLQGRIPSARIASR
jgi:hypothetical protein